MNEFSNMFPYMNYYMYPPTCYCHHMYYPFFYDTKRDQNNRNPYVPATAFQSNQHVNPNMSDQGKKPFVIDIEEAAERNNTFRTAIWTGQYLQVTLMSINIGEDVGLEVHPNHDQFLRIEEGEGLVQMGNSRDQLTFSRRVSEDSAIMVPAGMWHNITNTGHKPLKLYSIYAPPEHPFGTVHRTKEEAMLAESESN